MRWTEVLAELAADLTELKANGLSEAPEASWEPPEVEGEMTQAERAQAVALLECIRMLETKASKERAAVGGELRDLGSRRSATRAYARS